MAVAWASYCPSELCICRFSSPVNSIQGCGVSLARCFASKDFSSLPGWLSFICVFHGENELDVASQRRDSSIEFLAQNGLKACSLRNHLSMLGHYFSLYNWPVQALCAKKVSMLVKSVHVNARMQVKIKGIFSPELLKKLILKMKHFTNHATYVALCLVSFFGIFRLGSLCPDNLSGFDRTRFPVLGDVIWGPPGAHILITCSKTMQKSGEIHVVQLPLLKDSILCPVMALKEMIKILGQDKGRTLVYG